MSDDIAALQRLAFLVGRQLAPNDTPVEVILKGRAGRIAKLPALESIAEQPPVRPAVVPGWDFGAGGPRLDGTPVPIHGRKAELLRILAANGPLHVKALRDLWDKHMEEGTVRWWIGDLRKTLSQLFPGLDEPIATTDDGYVLQIR